MRKSAVLVFTALLLFGTLLSMVPGCGESLQEVSGPAMGSSYHIKFVTAPENNPKITQRVGQILAGFDEQLSNWRPDSWVSRFNDGEAGVAWPIPGHVSALMGPCRELTKNSGGAFDVTVTPLLELWGFGRNDKKAIPSAQDIKETMAYVGMQHLSEDPVSQKLTKDHKSVQLNFSALAAGYAVDLVADMMEDEFSICDYMVEVTGEIRVLGHPPGKSSWTLGVHKPTLHQEDESQRGFSLLLGLESGGLATSGDYQNYFELNGKTYQHIFDARSGWPVSHGLCSVSIIGPSCMMADALATACMVLGAAESRKLLEKYSGYEACFIERKGPEKYEMSQTAGFKRFVLESH